MTDALWYFDVLSPYVHLQHERLRQLGLLDELKPVPILLPVLLNHWGQLGPAEIAPKRKFVYRHVTWLASELGVPIQFPAAHPFNPLPLLRACIAAGSDWDAVANVIRFVWVDGHTPTNAQAMEALCRELSIDAEQLRDDEVKASLKHNTEQAIDAGVFGVPTLSLENRVFWGLDATEMFLAYRSNPELSEREDLQRLDSLPVEASRN